MLSDSVGKKANVLEDIVDRLGLKRPSFMVRCTKRWRKTASIRLPSGPSPRWKKLLEWFKPHWDSFTRLLVLKGPAWVEERGEARHFGLMKTLALRNLKSYPMPGTESESVLLSIGLRPKAK